MLANEQALPLIRNFDYVYPLKMQPKSFFLFLLLVLSARLLQAQVLINEYSCSNKNTIQDNFAAYNDWIELYNAGGNAVNLAGYYISDNINKPFKDTLPAITLAPGGRQLLFCSGRRALSGGYYHTSFKLNQTAPERILLSDNTGVIIDSLPTGFTIPAQVNHSRGRTTDGAETWSLFTTPTPGNANSNALSDYVPKPLLSLQAGFYTGASLTISMSCADPSAEIRFTTNGSTPTNTSPLYTSPLTIYSTTVIRARAFSSNPQTPPSFIEGNTYFLNVTHPMSVISVYGDQVATLFAGTQLNPETCLEYFDKNGVFRTETYGTSNEHGNDSWAYGQRGIDFISRDYFGYNYALTYPIFSRKTRPSFQRIILKAAANDNYPSGNGGTNGPAHIRDAYVNTLSQRSSMAMDERTWEPCVLYVFGQGVSNPYWGVYDIREKADDSDFTDYYYKQDEQYSGAPNDVQFIKTWGGTWNEYGGAQSATDWNNLVTYATSNNLANQAAYNYVDSLFNVNSMIDYFVLNSYCVTSDWLNWNTAWWRGLNPNGNKKKWRYSLWDMDATFGHYINYTGVPTQAPTANPCNPEQLSDPGGQGHVPLLNALIANPGFKQQYISRFIDLNNTTLSCNYMQYLLDSMVGVIAPEMQRQTARWGGTVTGWQTNVQAMKDYMTARCAAIDSGLIDCYSLSGPYPITFIADDPFRGDIKINSITPTSYPFNANYFGGVTVNLTAIPKNGGIFMGWDAQAHTLNPSNDSLNVTLNLNTGDTIFAYFSATGVKTENRKLQAFAVYPSVSRDAFTIDIPGTEQERYTISITSLQGQVLATNKVIGSSSQTYRSSDFDMTSGVYLITLRGPHEQQTRKLILLPE